MRLDLDLDAPGDVPDELAARLNRLADAGTAGSRPSWPAVDRVLRRSRRRRAGAWLAAGALAGGLLFVGLLDRSRTEPPAPAAPAKRVVMGMLHEGGYDGEPGGSLAHDEAFMNGVRHRVRTLAARRPVPGGGRATGLQLREILVPWASDEPDGRYAVVVYPSQDPNVATGYVSAGEEGSNWTVALLTGPRGAGGGRMDFGPSDPGGFDPDTHRITGYQELEVPTRSADRPGLVLVLGPTVHGVGIATGRHFSVDPPGVSTDRRQARREGAVVWVARLTAAEVYLSDDLAIDGADSGGGSGSLPTPVAARARAIAPPGTDLDGLDCASEVARGVGASAAEQPVIATSTAGDQKYHLTASAWRTPDGPFVVGFCGGTASSRPNRVPVDAASRYMFGTGGIGTGQVFAGTADTDRFMASVESDQLSADRCFLVLAPAGTTSVEVRGRSYPVSHRLVRVPDDDPNPYGPSVRVRALDAAGHELGSVISTPGSTR